MNESHFYHEGPSLQGWTLQVIRKAADCRGLIHRSKAVKALQSTPGFDWPQDVTVEQAIDSLIRQKALERRPWFFLRVAD